MRHHDLLDVSDAGQQTGRADQQLLPGALHIACAAIAVVALQRLGHIRQGQAPRKQAVRIGQHVVLLVVAADAVDLGHAGRQHQLWANDPFLHLAQTHGIPWAAVGLCRAGLGAHRVHVDLTQAGADRPHFGLQARRQLAADGRQPLVDEVAGEVEVSPFLEYHRHLRQRVARQGSGVGEFGQPGQGCFHGEGHPLFGFQRRVARSGGVDLDLDVGDVRHRIDGQ